MPFLWFKRKERKPTLEQVHLQRLVEMFEALPKPEVHIPARARK